MANLVPITPAMSGTNPSPAAAASGGDTMDNPRGNVLIVVANGGGSSINVTLVAQQTARGAGDGFPAMTLGNQVVAVPAGETRIIGPVPSAFNDAAGRVPIAYSAVTSVTIYGLRAA